MPAPLVSFSWVTFFMFSNISVPLYCKSCSAWNGRKCKNVHSPIIKRTVQKHPLMTNTFYFSFSSHSKSLMMRERHNFASYCQICCCNWKDWIEILRPEKTLWCPVISPSYQPVWENIKLTITHYYWQPWSLSTSCGISSDKTNEWKLFSKRTCVWYESYCRDYAKKKGGGAGG